MAPAAEMAAGADEGYILDLFFFLLLHKLVIIEFDPIKREQTLSERGLDFADAGKVFEGFHFVAVDDRCDYGEARFITVGLLGERVVVIVWTQRQEARRIISMRYANDREIIRYKKYLR